MDEEYGQLSTSHFILAAVLLVNDFLLNGLEPESDEPGRRKLFLLTGDPSDFAKMSTELLLDDVLVPARAFANAQRRLKQLLYDATPAAQPSSKARRAL
jgi:hypothetical protein